LSAIIAGAQVVNAEGAAAPAEEKVELGPAPEDFGLKYDFYEDCTKVVNHMRYAVQMEKGNPYLASVRSIDYYYTEIVDVIYL
jgi:hypothetical protein